MSNLQAVACCGMVLLLCSMGCQSVVEPDPEPTSVFEFAPLPTKLDVAAGQFIEFKVSHDFDPVFTVAWHINGQHVGIGPRYRYIPTGTNLDNLTATASYLNNTQHHSWIIDAMHDSPTVVGFTPPDDLQLVEVGRAVSFRMDSSRAPLTTYSWEIDGQTVGQEASFSYAGTTIGPDSLHATAITPDHTERRSWALQTFAEGLLPPLSPPGVTAREGAAISSLELSWQQAAAQGSPLATYLIAISYQEPIDVTNWDAAETIAEIPYREGEIAYTESITTQAHGLLAGSHAWLAIRGLNSSGVLALTMPNIEVDITEPWWITGTVSDETGARLPNVLVRDGSSTVSTLTDADGDYHLGPFTSSRRLSVRTETPNQPTAGETTGAWYDVVSDELAFAVLQEWDFTLITRYNITAVCEAYGGDFSVYLRSLTRTTHPTNMRPNQNLYKWETYPVTVWVPEFVSDDDNDYGALCREAVTWWNQTMGMDYLTLVADPAAARITFRFGDDELNILGQAKLIEPRGGDYVLGDVVPEKVEVYLLNRLGTDQRVQEVALHELGHTLGLSGHAACTNVGYLMYVSSAGILDNGIENAIHLDEIHALGIVRHLPQGFDMGSLLKGSD